MKERSPGYEPNPEPEHRINSATREIIMAAKDRGLEVKTAAEMNDLRDEIRKHLDEYIDELINKQKQK